MNYNVLNKAIYDFFYSGNRINTRIKYFDLVSRLAYIIIENTDELTEKKFIKKVDINRSIELATEFFNEINPKYAERFLNILREKKKYGKRERYSVNFYKSDIQESLVDINGLVNININETIEDVFTIVHEMTHKLKMPYNQLSSISDYFEETASITIEFLLRDFLIEKNEFDYEEIMKYENNRFLDTLEGAGSIIFENILLNLYCENGNYINKKMIVNYLKQMDKDSKIGRLILKNQKYYLRNIIEANKLQFYMVRLYIIGTLLACDLYDKIKTDKKNIKSLFALIDKLGISSFEFESDLEMLQKLDIPIINPNAKPRFKLYRSYNKKRVGKLYDKFLDITEDDIERLTINYQKELNNLMNTNLKTK